MGADCPQVPGKELVFVVVSDIAGWLVKSGVVYRFISVLSLLEAALGLGTQICGGQRARASKEGQRLGGNQTHFVICNVY